MSGRPLNCQESKTFETCKKQVIARLKISDSEFDEAYLFPLQQLIIYNPAVYPAVSGTKLHVFATTASPKYPSLYIAYTYDDKLITLRYAELKEVNNE